MKIKLLDTETLGDDLDFGGFSAVGEAELFKMTPPDEVKSRIKDADVLVLNKVKLFKENLMDAKNLKLICLTATGYDNVDIDYCREKGIGVCNVTGYSTDSVAQTTLAMAFSLISNLLSFNGFVKSGEYTKSGVPNKIMPVFHEISSLTWGIIGFGNIGKKVALVAEAMGCRVLAYKRTKDSDSRLVDFDKLITESDIITVHTPLNCETYQLINEKCIEKMKNNVIIVNVARGAVFDEKAVCEAVKSGKIGGLGVDVYSSEPMAENSPYQELLGFENVIFTPHMAWGAFESRQRCIDEVINNIESFKSGGMRCRIV